MCYRHATRRQRHFSLTGQAEVFLGHQGFLRKSKLVWFCKPIAKPSIAESLNSVLKDEKELSKATWSLLPSSGSSVPNIHDIENKQVPCFGGGGGFFVVFLFFRFLGPLLRHMEVPRLGVEWELQLPPYTTATATPDLGHVCDLLHSS